MGPPQTPPLLNSGMFSSLSVKLVLTFLLLQTPTSWPQPLLLSPSPLRKNGVRGKVVGLGKTGSPTFCPVRCLGRRVIHLRNHNAPPHTALAMYNEAHTWKPVKPSHITSALKLAATVLGPTFGFLAQDFSARSLRAAGAMVLLCANVDHDTIRLIGRWRSDEMLRYLHIQAEPVMCDMAKKMFHHGAFVLHPGQDVPMF